MQHFLRALLFTVCTAWIALPLSAQVTANFNSNVTSGCAPLLVQFNNTSTPGTTSSWDLGNSTTSVLQNPSTTYTSPGTYTVTLTVTNGSQSNTKTVTNYITVYPSPTVNFTVSDTAGCPPHVVTFTDQSVLNATGTGSYLWSFGDGTFSTQQNPPKTFALPGYYNISLQVTNAQGCSKTLSKQQYIHVYTPPVANFTFTPTSACDAPATFSFTSSITGSGPYTYSWTFGNSLTSTAANPSTTYTASGTYPVRLIVTDARGCKDTIQKSVNIGSLQAAFTGTTSVCVGGQAAFSNTSTPTPTGSLWDYGDGGTSSGSNGAHTYNAPGTYPVTLVSYNGACTDTVVHSVIVHPRPDANFTYTPDPPCPAPETIQFNNTTVNGGTYTWTFSQGSVIGNSTAINPTYTFLYPGGFNATLVAVSPFGCRDTVSKAAFLYPLYIEATADPEGGCVPLTVNFTDTAWTSMPGPAIYPYPVATHQWDFGDGTFGTGSVVSHTYTAVGVYYAVVTVTTVNGCVGTDTIKISVGTPPVASFSAAPTAVCASETIFFTNTSTNANYYIWEFGDGSIGSSIGNISHQFLNPGTFTVVLHAYNNGCEDTAIRHNYILIHPPNASFNHTFDCDSPTLVRFGNQSIGATSQIWYFGDNTTSTQQAPEHYYAGFGPYTCKLVTFNDTTGCSDTSVQTITPPNIQPDFYADTTICKGDSAYFHGVYSPGTINKVNWILINNFPYVDTTQDIAQQYTQNGRYTITMITNDFRGCWDTVTKVNYLRVSRPEVQFSASPVLGCVPLPVTFTDQSVNTPAVGTVNRAWDFGNGATASNNNASSTYTYTTAGVYDIKLKVTDIEGCADSMTKTAHVEARKPVASFVAPDTTGCIGVPVAFTNNSTSPVTMSFLWDFGDNTTSTAAAPSHTYTQTGNFTVRLIVTDASGCKDTMTRVNGISITKPSATFTMSDTLAICPPLMVQFTNGSTGAVSYQWTFGDGNSSVIPNPNNAYTSSGQYPVILVATDIQGCTDTAYSDAEILGYAGALSYSPLSGCAPLAVNFTATLTNVPTVIWDFSDGVTAPVTGTNTTTHAYLTPGTYVPKLIISDGQGCLTSSLGLDTIRVDGVIASFTTGPVCISNPTVFQDNSTLFFSPASSWHWTFNNGQTSTMQQPSYTYTATGTHPVTLVVTNANGCKDTITQNVVVNPLPVISAGADTAICVGDAAQLSASGGVSYIWTPSTGLSSTTVAAPTANPTSTTNYMVVGTDNNGCKSSDQVKVELQTKTTSDIGPDTTVCLGSSVQLNASGAQLYEWSPPASLDNAAVPNPNASPVVTTVYTLVAREGSCIPDTSKVKVTVLPTPSVNAGTDQTIVAGGSIVLNASGTQIDDFLWSPASTLSCTACSNPTATPLQTTEYVVLATNDYGCSDKDTVVIRIICNQSQVFIPNTFTPNGDGQNDVFYPHGTGLDKVKSFRVYNRWGQLVFEKNNFQVNDRSSGWDGTFNGEEQNPDIYVYVMEAVCENGEAINWKGDVALIR